LKAGLAVRESGGTVLATLAIFTYEFDAATALFEAEGIPLNTLSRYTVLIQAALELGYIKPEDVALLSAWRQDPKSYFA
jgi:orotate phosphoribosyltransferase